MKQLISVFILAAVLGAGCARSEPEEHRTTSPEAGLHEYADNEIIPGTLIIQVGDPDRADQTIEVIEAIPDVAFDKMLFDSPELKIISFTVPDGRELELAEVISRVENVALAEPNLAGSYGGQRSE